MKKIIITYFLLFIIFSINAQVLRNYKVKVQIQAPNGSFSAPYYVFVGIKKYNESYGVYEYQRGAGNDDIERLKSSPLITVLNYRDREEIKRKLIELTYEECKIVSVSYYNKPSPYHKLHNERGHEIPIKKKVNYQGEFYHQHKFRPINKSTRRYLNFEDWLVTYLGEKQEGGEKYKLYNYYKFSNNEWKLIFDDKMWELENQKFNFLYVIQSYYHDKNIFVKDFTTVK